MTIIIFSIIFLFVLSAYAYLSNRDTKTFIQCVEAGSTAPITAEELNKKSFYDENKIMLDCEGKILNPKLHYRVTVNGKCLLPKGVNDRDKLIVKKFTESDTPNLQPGKIIHIFIEETGINKIREIKSVNGTEILTQYYLDDGTPHDSSKPHNISQVKGIVMHLL